MSEGVVRRRRRKLGVALLFSALVHGGFSGLLIWRALHPDAAQLPGTRGSETTLSVPGLMLTGGPEAIEPTLVELAVASEVLPQAPEPTAEKLPEYDVDRRSEVAASTSPALADGAERNSPMADEGPGAGSARPVVAVRADASTSRQRLTDGASSYRLSRMKTGWHRASPEPERREQETGTGDVLYAARNASEFARVPVVQAGDDPAGAQQGDALSDRPAAAASVEGKGALETNVGPQRFDTDVTGPAVDQTDVRSASDERNPQPLETVAVAAAGSAATEHRGPGDAPGVVARASPGSALAQHGSPVPAPVGPTVAVSAAQARRAGFEREIQQRARKAMVFPRRMALMLEQGDTIVRFVVGKDGQIEGPVDVIRSAGFPEFDAEAQAAARRAAPYPKMPEPLTINLRFVFSNPLVR